jgi:pentatricopeptide repeat protein
VCILCRLNDIGKMRQIFLSRLMHSARLKWTEGRLLRLVQLLGDKGNWRRAIQVVHWVHCREHFKHCKSRHVYTTLLDVLGKCWRPVEALNMFNVMREDFSTYPDMAAYHSIAVTLGQAGHLTELLGLIEALQVRPKKDSIKGTRRRFDWNGLLYPDIVVYNAVINACGPHHQWQGAMWAMQQMQARGIAPNSASFGLSIEVMVKSGQVGSAWKLYERMERGGFLPNALTFKALVEALGKAGEADKAVEMVKDMRQRGFVDCAGVYYALACTLCTVGRWSEALLQV